MGPEMNSHRSTILAFLLLVLVVTLAPVAWARNYPPTPPTIGVSDNTVPQGGTTVVSGKNWDPGSTVSLTLLEGGCSGSSAGSLGTAAVNTNGMFSKTVTLDVAPGTYGIQGSGFNRKGNAATRCVTVQVLGITVAPGTAFTGANIVFGLMLAIVLIVMGLIALAASRRRARPSPPR
jgi:hypothetical protein